MMDIDESYGLSGPPFDDEDKIGCHAREEDGYGCTYSNRECGLCPDSTAAPFTRGLAKKRAKWY